MDTKIVIGLLLVQMMAIKLIAGRPSSHEQANHMSDEKDGGNPRQDSWDPYLNARQQKEELCNVLDVLFKNDLLEPAVINIGYFLSSVPYIPTMKARFLANWQVIKRFLFYRCRQLEV